MPFPYGNAVSPIKNRSHSRAAPRPSLIAHTTRLEGYRQMPDGLVRVVGLKLK